eukprot:gene12192-16333_t
MMPDDLGSSLPTVGEPIEEGTSLVILERGEYYGQIGLVAKKNKGRGRVIIRIGGIEMKMERHLVGVPKTKERLSRFLNKGLTFEEASTASLDELTPKERKLLKIINEELVDYDALVDQSNSIRAIRKKNVAVSSSNKNNNNNSNKATQAVPVKPIISKRVAENTIDLKHVESLNEMQASTLRFLQKIIDDPINVRNPIDTIYVYHGSAKDHSNK